MEDQCSILGLGWAHFCQEGVEELRHSLLYTTLELESTIVSAKDEIARREVEMLQMKELLSKAMNERDEAQAQCQKLVVDKLMLQQQLQQHNYYHKQQEMAKKDELETTPQSSSEDDEYSKGSYNSISNNTKQFQSSDDGNESHIASPPPPPLVLPQEVMELVGKKALPEKGKLLQAVMEAGPLLQTLLLAGPLPQWQHPPPKLDSIEIPPVTISSSPTTPLGLNCFTKKRASVSQPSPITKIQKLVLH